ncbi:MAG: hypothetical protein K5985_10075 [Lachnospiraceae bacterium]|nr:hypothetical protein [Lachnospiraceae bacterium]
MNAKNQIVQMIDYVPENDLAILLEVVKHFISDDIATPDDLEAHREAEAEYAAGETINHNDIKWD